MKVVKRIISNNLHHKETSFPISLILYLYEIIEIHLTYCGNNSKVYVN